MALPASPTTTRTTSSTTLSWAPIGVALLSSVAWSLHVASGSLCRFVLVTARAGEILAIVRGGSDNIRQESTTIGIACTGDFYVVDGDFMWRLSRVFWGVSLVLGASATLASWVIGLCRYPTAFYWRWIAGNAALAAVLQIPTFLLLESYPCKDETDLQSCQLDSSSYLAMVSVVLWIALVFVTQLCDPCAMSNDATWRAPPKPLRRNNNNNHDSNNTEKRERKTFFNMRDHPQRRISEDRLPILPLNATETLSEEGMDGPLPSRKQQHNIPPLDVENPAPPTTTDYQRQHAVPQLNATLASDWDGVPVQTRLATLEEQQQQQQQHDILQKRPLSPEPAERSLWQSSPPPEAAADNDTLFVFPKITGNDSLLDQPTLHSEEVLANQRHTPDFPNINTNTPQQSLNQAYALREAGLPPVFMERSQRAPPLPAVAAAAAVQGETNATKRNPNRLGRLARKKLNAYAALGNDDEYSYDMNDDMDMDDERNPSAAAHAPPPPIEILTIGNDDMNTSLEYGCDGSNSIPALDASGAPSIIDDDDWLDPTNYGDDGLLLMADWDALHQSNQKQRQQQQRKREEHLLDAAAAAVLPNDSFDDGRDDYYYRNDDDDSGSSSSSSGSDYDDDDDNGDANVGRSLAEAPTAALSDLCAGADPQGFLEDPLEDLVDPREVAERILRRREQRRRRKRRGKSSSAASLSVCSSPSLLHTVIAEETAEEVEDEAGSEVEETPRRMRTLSAPNLAGYFATSQSNYAAPNIAENLSSVQGMNAYHRVEVYKNEEDDSGTPKKSSACKPPPSPTKVAPKSTPSPAKSVWREERERRRGIHSLSMDEDSNSSSSEKEQDATRGDRQVDTSSPTSVRDARIRRISPLTAAAAAKRQRSRTLDPPKDRVRYPRQVTSAGDFSPARESVRTRSLSPPRRDPVPTKASFPTPQIQAMEAPAAEPRVVTPEPKNAPSNSPSSSEQLNDEDSLFNTSALNYEENFILDNLDVGLAELHRPYNAEYGPDEQSV